MAPALIGLLGAMLGAAISFASHILMHRLQRRDSLKVTLLESCALLIGLADEFRNRIFEERTYGKAGVVSDFDVVSFRRAEAQVRLLAGKREIRDDLQRLREATSELGEAWRLGLAEDEITAAWDGHRVALDAFIKTCSKSFVTD